MKTITLKDIRIKEIVIQPDSDIALSITYELLDDNNDVIAVKNTRVNKDEFSAQGRGALTTFANGVLAKIKTAEQL